MSGVSRRDFLKAAGAVGLGGVAAGIGTTTAFANNTSSTSDEQLQEETLETYDYATHTADVVVVGGGLAGATAARRALAKGASVIVVDKGPWGHSGTSGINWGHNATTNEFAEDDGSSTLPAWVRLTEGLANQEFGLALCQAVKASRPCATFEQMGCILERNAEGKPYGGNTVGIFGCENGTLNRYLCLDATRKGADVYDRTMMLDLLEDGEGNAAGIVAIDMKDGSAHVFRGKTVVFATGSFRWVSGYNGLKPHTIAGPENTGDGIAVMLRHGLAMADMEQQPIDFVQWNPIGVRQGMGSMGGSIINWPLLYDGNQEPLVPEDRPASQVSELARWYYRAQIEGRGTENGGVYVDITQPQANDRYYRRCQENEKKFLDYQIPDFAELVAEQWDDAGHPYDYSATAETGIPGLFYASSGQGVWNGVGFFPAYGSGVMAGDGAAIKALETEVLPAINVDDVQTILADAYGLLKGDQEDGLRSTVVFREIQEAWWSGMSPLRDETGIQATLDELNRIEVEDLPRMVIPAKSPTYNTDWHRAIETRAILMCAQAATQAALLRKECRGCHVRTDYPKMDNENFLKNTKVSYADGQWSATLEDIRDIYIPAEDVKGLVLDFGLVD